MSLGAVDDCIKKIYLEDGTTLYELLNMICSNGHVYCNNPIFTPIPFDIGHKIFVDVGDNGGGCSLKIFTNINNNIISQENRQFQTCTNCGGTDKNYIYDEVEQKFLCFTEYRDYSFSIYKFYFQLKNLSELEFNTSEYFYYLKSQNYFCISPKDLNQSINLIDLHSIDNLYSKNEDGKIIEPFYEFISYKLIFNNSYSYPGIFIGSDKDNNDIELTESNFSTISENKNLRYELSESEIKNNGTHLRFKLGIYNNYNKLLLYSENYEYFICLKGYQFVDIEASFKCIKEGYYQSNDKYYSCHEPCKTCLDINILYYLY